MPKRASSNPQAELRAMQAAHHALASLPRSAQQRAILWLCHSFELPTPVATQPRGRATRGGVPGLHKDADLTALRTLLETKRPATNADRIAVLTWFAMRAMGQQGVRTRDLSRLNAAAGQPAFTNAAVAVKMARLKGWLAPRGGLLVLTDSGASYVDRLPEAAGTRVNRGGRPRKHPIAPPARTRTRPRHKRSA